MKPKISFKQGLKKQYYPMKKITNKKLKYFFNKKRF